MSLFELCVVSIDMAPVWCAFLNRLHVMLTGMATNRWSAKIMLWISTVQKINITHNSKIWFKPQANMFFKFNIDMTQRSTKNNCCVFSNYDSIYFLWANIENGRFIVNEQYLVDARKVSPQKFFGRSKTKQDKVYNGPRVVESISAIWK